MIGTPGGLDPDILTPLSPDMGFYPGALDKHGPNFAATGGSCMISSMQWGSRQRMSTELSYLPVIDMRDTPGRGIYALFETQVIS